MSPEGMRAVLAKKRPGDTIVVELYRGDRRMKVTVKLGRAPAGD
jgi:S1-C subfamily serine protease